MALFGRRLPGHRSRPAADADLDHLAGFARSRTGVEAYLEPQTTMTEPTVVLIATSGEWTRRRVGSPDAARKFAKKLGIPVYDVAATGYPPRMREWTARRKASGETGVPGLPGPSV